MVKIGLSVMRLQPLHNGHVDVITTMFSECTVKIVGIGSAQEYGTIKNPYPAERRKKFLRKVFPEEQNFYIVEIPDLGGNSKEEWVSHIFSIIEKHDLPIPTDYYGGCEDNISWYKESGMDVHFVENARCIRATNIREAIMKGEGGWAGSVPFELYDWINYYFPYELRK